MGDLPQPGLFLQKLLSFKYLLALLLCYIENKILRVDPEL